MKAASLVVRAKQSRLARDTLWMFMGQGARIPIQAVYFILIARALGPQGYGAFVGVAALVAILSPFGSLGSGNLLIKNVAVDPSRFRPYWGKALVTTAVCGSALVLVVMLLSMVLLPASIPSVLVLCVALADLVFTRLLDASAQAFQAFQRLSRTSMLMVLPNVARLACVIALVLVTPSISATLWGYFYLLGILASSLTGIFLVNRELGAPAYDKGVIYSELKEGIYFSTSLSSQNVYNDIDKTMLAKLATLEAAGIYGAAYRIIDVSFTPVRSLLWASYTRYFKSGADGGIHGTLSLTGRLLPYAAGYGLAISLLLFAAAPVLPYILGSGYQDTVVALRWLSVLPLMRVLQFFAADSLTGAGFQGLRSGCQLLTAALNLMLILWLIPLYSWRGAVWASLLTDGFLAALLLIAIYAMHRRSVKVAA